MKRGYSTPPSLKEVANTIIQDLKNPRTRPGASMRLGVMVGFVFMSVKLSEQYRFIKKEFQEETSAETAKIREKERSLRLYNRRTSDGEADLREWQQNNQERIQRLLDSYGVSTK